MFVIYALLPSSSLNSAITILEVPVPSPREFGKNTGYRERSNYQQEPRKKEARNT